MARAIRRLLLGTLSDPVYRWPPDRRIDAGLGSNPRLLVVRTDRIGDAIVSTPLLRSLRARFPHATIDILLGERNAGVAPLLPHLDGRFVLGANHRIRTLRTLRSRRYDLALNLQLKPSVNATLLSRAAGARRVLEYPIAAPFISPPEDCLHIVAMTSRLLGPLGVEPLRDDGSDRSKLEVSLPSGATRKAGAVRRELFDPGDTGPRIFVNLSAGSVVRRPSEPQLGRRLWPLGKVADVLLQLRNAGFTPVLCGAPEDGPALERVVRLSQGASRLLPCTPDYPEFAAMLDLADAVVSPDTSVTHLAAALGKPVVALFHKAANGSLWGPWGVPHEIVSHEDGISAIDPGEVLRAVRDLLSRVPEAPGSPPPDLAGFRSYGMPASD